MSENAQLKMIDAYPWAKSRARASNGRRAIGVYGFALLCAVPSLVVQGGAVRGTRYALSGLVLLGLALMLRRESRTTVLVGAAVYAAVLPLLWPVPAGVFAYYAVYGYAILRGVLAAFLLMRAPHACDDVIPVRERLAWPTRPASATFFLATGAVAFVATQSLITAYVDQLSQRAASATGLSAASFFSIDSLKGGGLIGLTIGTYVLTGWCFKRAERYVLARATSVLARDARPPVLLLRSFSDDNLKVEREFRFSLIESPSHTFAEELTAHLWLYGPVLAVGKPGESLPPAGAAREYISGDDWQKVVTRWCSSALMIVVIPGRTQGVCWEMRNIATKDQSDKTVIVVPPIDTLERKWRWAEAMRELGIEHLKESVPLDHALALLPVRNGQSLCVTSRKRKSVHYQEALDIAAAAIRRSSGASARGAEAKQTA